MGRKGGLEGLLARKDEQISKLEIRIQAYTGRLSLLQSRLLASLDTLDVIQINQAQELSTSVRTQARLREQLDEYVKIVEAAELERDDMRDAVIKLIEKVETSNDYSHWPHSQIRLSSLPDPAALTQRDPARSREDQELISYASSLIETLRRERDAERKAHAQTHEQAEARMLTLEAKVSRREAELEACIASAKVDAGTEPEQTTPRAKTRVFFEEEGDIMVSDQITAMLDESVARNKKLESEITSLYRRLEQARATKSENQSDDTSVLSSPTPTSTIQQAPQPIGAPHLNSDVPRSTTYAVSSPPQYPLGEDTQTPTDSPRVRDESFHDPDPTYAVLRGLENQIMVLGEKIDVFARERHVLFETISHNPLERPRDTSYIEGEDLETYRLSNRQIPHFHEHNRNLEKCLQCLNDGCASLQASADALRDELAATTAAAQLRESALIDVINELRLALLSRTETPSSDIVEEEIEPEERFHQTENVPPEPNTPNVNNQIPFTDNIVYDPNDFRDAGSDHHHDHGQINMHGDGNDDGEIPMEIATPLMPLSTIPASPFPSRSASHYGGSDGGHQWDEPASPAAASWAPVPVPDESIAGGETTDIDGRGRENAGGDWVTGADEPEAEDEGYVDPPSIPLPPSPPDAADQLQLQAGVADAANALEAEEEEIEEDFEEADSPTLSHIAPLPGVMDPHAHSRSLYHATSSFVAELRHVENEIAMTQAQLDEGVDALQRVEELVAELDPP